MKQLGIEPIKQESWYLQIKDEVQVSKRITDQMSTSEIRKMYHDKNFLCDTCGKSLGKCDFKLEEHIIHMINPAFWWSCDDCMIKDMKNGDIIGTDESDHEKWQSNNT